MSNDSAESSSFVSPQRGWVLERSGRVVSTTDGGATWRSVGVLRGGGANMAIRFADASHGFAFHSTGGGGAKPVFATTDGGTHWAQLATPFSDVFALAISRGIVYTVAFEEPGGRFRIWSSPAGRLAWTEDPLPIAPGAGPVPAIQLVFSGAHGWIVENDRVVSGGAKLAPDSRWIPWVPRCDGGYADLAASTGSDLVVSCLEGVWTGPRITKGIYFSHDGGASFERRDAPQAGPVASPQADIAVVVDSHGIERTTDAGGTWQKANRVPGNGNVTDLGFTTTTQGFVIFDSGLMLMTHDAGATWRRVSLP